MVMEHSKLKYNVKNLAVAGNLFNKFQKTCNIIGSIYPNIQISENTIEEHT